MEHYINSLKSRYPSKYGEWQSAWSEGVEKHEVILVIRLQQIIDNFINNYFRVSIIYLRIRQPFLQRLIIIG